MGGNLKGALEGLSTAWDSLKTALFDPVLEPITDAANELSTSLNTNLKDGALKPTQAAIKSFAENSIAALKDFFASFDTSEVGPKLQQFAADAKAAFDSMASGGKAAADVVTIAWNTLTAGFKTISAGLLAIASSVLGNLAVIESAAAKVGLGSIERANELNTKALEMKTRASELLTQVAQDGREIGAAYDSLTAKTDTAADAQKNLKTALPVAELQALTYTLADYQGIANKANAATAQAKADYEAGKTSGAAYASAIQAASEANYALEKATQSQTAATKSGVSQATIMKSALDAQYQAVIDNAKAAQTLTDEQLKTNVAAIKVTQAEIELAKAKGDTSRVTQLQTKLAQQEVDLAQQTAVAKLQEAAALREQLTNRLQYRASLAESNTELDREIQLLAARTLTADQEAASTAASAQAQQILADKLRQTNAAKQGATNATNENTGATKENTEATDGAANSSGGLAKVIGSLIEFWREKTRALSEATMALFELKAGLSEGIEIDLFGNLSDEAIKATKEIENANAMIIAMNTQMLYSTGSVGYFMDKVQKAGAQATKAYYEQKIAAEELEAQINKVGIGAITRFGATESAVKKMTESVESSIKSFELLNDEDLGQIRAALDSANDKLKEMQDLTQSAKDRLTELNAEILEAQGQDQQAELLRQQLDYQQQLAEIEKQRADAQLAGNTELLRLLDQQAAKLKTLNDLKIKNIEADNQAQSATQKTTSDLNALADATGRATSGLKSLGEVDLSGVTSQAGQLTNYFNELNGVL
jgi:hypothetical protein